jgi:hypothetical protein
MELITKTKNVARGETIFRYVLGVILIISAISTSGLLRWILGLIGVVVILTAIFGY